MNKKGFDGYGFLPMAIIFTIVVIIFAAYGIVKGKCYHEYVFENNITDYCAKIRTHFSATDYYDCQSGNSYNNAVNVIDKGEKCVIR